MQALLLKQQHEFAEACVGKTIDILLEKPGRMPGQLIGRSPWLQSVNVDAKSSQIGDIISVRIIGDGAEQLVCGADRELNRPSTKQEHAGLNGRELVSSSSRNHRTAATDANHFVLTFENNRLAKELFGQFDQNLKLLEERLHIDARARGNSVSISGEVLATTQAAGHSIFCMTAFRRVARQRHRMLKAPIRMAIAADDQLTLPPLSGRRSSP